MCLLVQPSATSLLVCPSASLLLVQPSASLIPTRALPHFCLAVHLVLVYFSLLVSVRIVDKSSAHIRRAVKILAVLEVMGLNT